MSVSGHSRESGKRPLTHSDAQRNSTAQSGIGTTSGPPHRYNAASQGD